jgi:hypothetical protein
VSGHGRRRLAARLGQIADKKIKTAPRKAAERREAALHTTLTAGVELLSYLSATPAENLTGADMHPEDLRFLASFLAQIAKAKERFLKQHTDGETQ